MNDRFNFNEFGIDPSQVVKTVVDFNNPEMAKSIDAEYYHITHVHRNGQFGYGDKSTSHIEQLWSVLKELFRRVYVTIPCLYFTLFLKEIEWRYLI